MKKIAPILLACLLLVTALTGCAASPAASASRAPEASAAATSNPTVAPSAAAEPPYTVNLMLFGDASTDSCNAVSDAVSKITLEKISAKIHLVRIGFGDYANQLNLALSSGGNLDTFCTLGTDITALADNGQIMPIDDLLAKYGMDIKTGISEEDFRCASVKGKVYGIRTSKETATSFGFILLKSVADEIGVTPDPAKYYTLDEIGDIITKAKAAHADQYPIGTDFTNMYIPNTMDNLDSGLGVLEDALGSGTTVVNWYKTATYVNFVNTMYKWAQAGLIMPNASTNSESRLNLMQAGKVMGGFSGMNPGNVDTFASQLGKPIAQFKVSKVFSITGHVSGVLWCITGKCGSPEKTMEFLNMAYTNADVSNLLVNGIEGKQYVIVDKANGVIDYPAGVTASNTTYSRMTWAWPNAAIAYIWKGVESPTFWKDLADYNKNAYQSPAKGFRFNTENVQNELTACSNVVAKYDVALQCGELDPAATLPQFYDELTKAGIDKVIQEKQTQLNAWLARK